MTPPSECLRHMRATALHTHNRLLSSYDYREPNKNATMATQLSPYAHALLQSLDSVQPASRLALVDMVRNISFSPMKVDDNPLRLKAQPYTITLTHPDTRMTPETYSVRPPRLRSHTRGDTT
jgi:hypothetical protein